MRAGQVWRIEVSDTTPHHNIRVVGAGVNRRTSVPGKSRHVWTVTLKRGKLTLYSERTPTRRFSLVVL